MKVLVCGGRNYADGAAVYWALDSLLPHGLTMVIQGGARGADQWAGQWATERGIHQAVVRPLWRQYGNDAGRLRNTAMLELAPDLVVAMPGGTGTRNMMKQARAAGVAVWEPCALR